MSTTNADTTRFLELLEKRIGLLNTLAEALTAARADIVSFDIDGLETRIAAQERLCLDIRSLDGDLDRIQRQCAAHLKPPSSTTGKLAGASVNSNLSPRLQETLHRLHDAQAKVKQLNDAHQALLRRSRRTIGALLNTYRTLAPGLGLTYSDPAARYISAGIGAGERI